MTLRNPARHDQLKEASTFSTRHFEQHDINHVREKFPQAAEFLHHRLGRAISKHRQYFKYREAHHSKLAEGLEDTEQDQAERPSTVATSLYHPDQAKISMRENQDETGSVYTATSFAPTLTGATALRPPPLPEGGRNGKPFECTICYSIVSAEDEQAWR